MAKRRDEGFGNACVWCVVKPLASPPERLGARHCLRLSRMTREMYNAMFVCLGPMRFAGPGAARTWLSSAEERNTTMFLGPKP